LQLLTEDFFITRGIPPDGRARVLERHRKELLTQAIHQNEGYHLHKQREDVAKLFDTSPSSEHKEFAQKLRDWTVFRGYVDMFLQDFLRPFYNAYEKSIKDRIPPYYYLLTVGGELSDLERKALKGVLKVDGNSTKHRGLRIKSYGRPDKSPRLIRQLTDLHSIQDWDKGLLVIHLPGKTFDKQQEFLETIVNLFPHLANNIRLARWQGNKVTLIPYATQQVSTINTTAIKQLREALEHVARVGTIYPGIIEKVCESQLSSKGKIFRYCLARIPCLNLKVIVDHNRTDLQVGDQIYFKITSFEERDHRNRKWNEAPDIRAELCSATEALDAKPIAQLKLSNLLAA
jgi:hypothetical protein